MPLLPLPPQPCDRRTARCMRCHRPTNPTHLVDGLGPECARQAGLTPPTARVRAATQEGPDLFDQLNDTKDNDNA